jgi:hypothetical protein
MIVPGAVVRKGGYAQRGSGGETGFLRHTLKKTSTVDGAAICDLGQHRHGVIDDVWEIEEKISSSFPSGHERHNSADRT